MTPDLPPPLDGESYECYFTVADDTPFFTDAVQVMTNTQYVCNLTEVVPDFQGASLGKTEYVCIIANTDCMSNSCTVFLQ